MVWVGSRHRRHGDGGDHAVDAADVAAAAEAVVPLLPPPLSPRVLDDPVGAVAQPQRREAARAVADEEHAVVDPRARAEERARHPAHVRLHERRVEPHREGTAPDQRRADLGLVAGRHRGEVGHADGGLRRVEAARPRRARVRVRPLLHQPAGLHQVRVRVRHQPAGAAVVALVLRHRAALETWDGSTKRSRHAVNNPSSNWTISFGEERSIERGQRSESDARTHRVVAVDQLLLAELEELPRGEEVGALHGARRAERPARPARALHLDAGDGALVAPVEAGGQPGHLLLRRRRGGRRATHHEPLDVPAGAGAHAREAGLELLPREVGEGRDPVARGRVQRLVRRRAGQVGREHAQPTRVLLGPGVPPPVPPHERRELRLREQP